ncbi:MAG: MFS transporter [Deltaproteobacteria bacterium]|nr:MFS transporter [Deltaproteobacteria bacterium]MBW2359485.1 MFS transporter [Deltaproteobacteria bacterium]
MQSTRRRQRPRLLTPSFTALLVANVCFGYAFSSFFLLPKFMANQLGAGPREVGFVLAAHGATIVILLPLIGAAVDRFGRRAFLTAGALAMAAITLCFPLVHEVGPLLYALRVAQAVAFAMVFAAGGALAVDLAPPERLGQGIGLYGTSFLSMNAVATACSEALAGSLGWPVAFAVAAGSALLSALLSLRVREPPRDPADVGTGDGLATLARRASTWRVAIVIGLVGAGLNAVFSFHQLYVLELGITNVSSFFVAYTAAAVTVRFVFGHYIDRWGHRNVSLAALTLYVFAVLGVAFVQELGLPLIGLGIGLAHGVFYPSFNAVVVAGAKPAVRGKVMGIFQASFQLGSAVGGIVFGTLAAREGYPPVFVAAAAGLAFAWVVLKLAPEGRNR